ncbi:hypothetical protein [Falsirhodobacter sp. 20TX0035]|uniref:hypothetical protein n=1 Tax=Falsirhodobacter sp. 20TX0035 TaxID=3022019 RepID=UPI00232DEB95|nr:hypothetical protein [Falsirhodobacter sp. 20TX0035]MDB6455036.1 hypothetical protein [Falsirhodobacter sp. 20TX0035]
MAFVLPFTVPNPPINLVDIDAILGAVPGVVSFHTVYQAKAVISATASRVPARIGGVDMVLDLTANAGTATAAAARWVKDGPCNIADFLRGVDRYKAVLPTPGNVFTILERGYCGRVGQTDNTGGVSWAINFGTFQIRGVPLFNGASGVAVGTSGFTSMVTGAAIDEKLYYAATVVDLTNKKVSMCVNASATTAWVTKDVAALATQTVTSVTLDFGGAANQVVAGPVSDLALFAGDIRTTAPNLMARWENYAKTAYVG